ncbi:MAG TPA: DNA polymerase III subunit delta' [Anaerolineaceae bacterium]|nr:DNA polymerase III subunit delta' [Anaerolineaceae bacterium]
MTTEKHSVWGVFAHEWAAELLARHAANGEVRHAYLFTGPPGAGRRTLALKLAQAVNCLNPAAPGVPCNACRACLQLERLQHPDLSILAPEEGSNTIKVEQVRALQHALSLSPYEARYRVALLLNFEQATISAQNALLKTLEEAPEKVILLLTAESAENLLPTIVSRCEVLRLRPASIERLAETLRERWDVPPDEARQLAHLAGGRPGYALRLHQEPGLVTQHEDWLADLGMLLAAPLRERLAWVDANHKRSSRDALRAMFQTWLSFWRDLMLASAGSDAPLTNVDHAADLRALAGRIDFATAHARIADLEQAFTRLDANVNARLLLETLLLDWPQIRD